MSRQKQENSKNTVIKKHNSNKRPYWKLFWGVLTLMTIVLAILSRQWTAAKSDKLVDGKLTPLPKNPFLPDLSSPITPLPEPSVKIKSFPSIDFQPGPSADIHSVLYKLSYDSCQDAIGSLLKERGFFSHLKPQNNRPLKIVFDSQHPVHQRSIGMYNPSQRMIELYYFANNHAQFVNAYTCLRTLRNEYFGYQVQVRNELNAVPDKGNLDIMSPFLNAQGEVDKEKYQRYKGTIDIAMKRVYITIAEMKKASKNRNANAQQFISMCLNVIDCYQPKVYSRFKEICEINFEENWWQIEKNGRISPGSAYKSHFPVLYGQRLSDGSCTYQYAPDYNTSLARLRGLLGDLHEIHVQFFRRPDSIYLRLPEHQKYTELGSTYADFPPEIGELLFPEFYEYMHEFFAQENPRP